MGPGGWLAGDGKVAVISASKDKVEAEGIGHPIPLDRNTMANLDRYTGVLERSGIEVVNLDANNDFAGGNW